MQGSFENQNTQSASSAEFHNDDQLDLRMADPRLKPYEAVAGRALAGQTERRRELLGHEKIGAVGEKLDHFRLWEQERAEESDFTLWERELHATSSPSADQTGYELIGQ